MPSLDTTQLCPTEASYFPTSLPTTLAQEFGLGKAPALRNRKRSWKRYGWELIRRTIGKERLAEIRKQEGSGEAKILSPSLLWTPTFSPRFSVKR
ncbi:hypothetical protein RvY_10294-3 [Ramazzottius varieornatus]|uniref:Uncharacterized protein n=1 Tax=Ramazzottius varieornatus TaxID=947166 RepID=A0A1D1VHP3_RAMVA|nr:hypothetical protein RvY_10294-3 [Ramazzottius varieornatus]